MNMNAHAIELSVEHEDTLAHTTLPVPQADSTISGKPVLKIAAYKPR